MNKLDTLYELLEKSCHDIIQSEESWLSFLKTSGYLYNFNFTNQLLIYQQRPDAKACTDFETWNNRMNRWIKKGSKGIALIDDDGRYTKIRYVFDIADTRSPHNRELHLWSVQESFHKQLIDRIAKQFDMTSNDEDLGSFIKEIAKEQTGYYVDDYFKRLMKLKDGSLLESYGENELKNLYRNLLENSVAYSLMSRCDIETKFYFEADDFISIELFNTPEMLGVIGNSFQEESNSLLNVIFHITKELIIQNRTFENNNRLVDDKIEKNEGSVINGTNHILNSGRLSNAQFDSRQGDTFRKIRNDEEKISEGTATRNSLFTSSKESTELLLNGNREEGKRNDGNVDEGIVNEKSSTKQRDTSDGMGTAYEQPSKNSGRNHSEGNNLQLDLGIKEVDKEKGGDNVLPPFDLSDLPQLLREDVSLQHSKYLKEYNHIYKEANDIYHEIARKLQLSDSALDIFYTIFEMGDNCLQRDICKASCMPKQTVNSSIRKLQTDGYLTLSPGKGRSMHIHLTPSGQKLIQEKLVPLIRIENDAFEDMTVEECEQLIHLNAKYNQTLRSRLSNLEEDL